MRKKFQHMKPINILKKTYDCLGCNFYIERHIDPGLRRFPGKSHGNQLQFSCLENSMDRGAWRARVHGVAKSQT